MNIADNLNTENAESPYEIKDSGCVNLETETKILVSVQDHDQLLTNDARKPKRKRPKKKKTELFSKPQKRPNTSRVKEGACMDPNSSEYVTKSSNPHSESVSWKSTSPAIFVR